MPAVAMREPPAATHDDPKNKSGGGGEGGGGSDDLPPDVDPIIEGFLKRLPKLGDVWPETERKLWLQLLEGSFKLIYKDQAAGLKPPPY